MTQDFFTRVPPQNIEAEQAVVGSVLTHNELFEQVAEVLVADDFYGESHRLLWQAFDALSRAKRPIDMSHLKEAVRPNLEAVGGASYIADLAAGLWVPSLTVDNARIVKEKSTLRQLASAASGIIERVHEAPDQYCPDWTDEQIALAEYDIAQVANQVVRKPEPKKAEILDTVLWNLEHQVTHAVPTGFPSIDRSFGGFNVGHLTILAARTSKGKTAFATNIAINVANAGLTTLFFTLEMTAEEMWERVLAGKAQVNTFAVRSFGLRDDQRERLGLARREIADMPLQILYRPSMTPRELRLECQRAARDMGGLKLVVVDYFNLMRGDHHERERWREMQEVVLALKAIAGELGIPFLLLSQLNRETKEDQPPSPANLRDTGATEEHASNVLLLWQKPSGKDSVSAFGEPEEIELIIGKQRNGPAGLHIPLKFDKRCGKFFE